MMWLLKFKWLKCPCADDFDTSCAPCERCWRIRVIQRIYNDYAALVFNTIVSLLSGYRPNCAILLLAK